MPPGWLTVVIDVGSPSTNRSTWAVYIWVREEADGFGGTPALEKNYQYGDTQGFTTGSRFLTFLLLDQQNHITPQQVTPSMRLDRTASNTSSGIK